MLVLRYVFDFIKLLHSETSANQLCWGFVVGMFMGFTPMLSLFWLSYVLLLLILRVNIGAALLGYAVFGICAFFLDPLFHKVGYALLVDSSGLRPIWTSLYHSPVVPYTRFNNTIVLGSVILSIAACLPIFFLSRILVDRYRNVVVAKIRNSYFAKTVMATKLYRLYAKYRDFKS